MVLSADIVVSVGMSGITMADDICIPVGRVLVYLGKLCLRCFVGIREVKRSTSGIQKHIPPPRSN